VVGWLCVEDDSIKRRQLALGWIVLGRGPQTVSVEQMVLVLAFLQDHGLLSAGVR
jgi:hypothetical protein